MAIDAMANLRHIFSSVEINIVAQGTTDTKRMIRSMRVKTMFMRLLIVGLILTLTAANVTAAPTVSVYTDKDVYESGDTIEVSFSCSNDDEDILASVYFGFFPDGGEIEALGPGGWSSAYQPWIGQLTLQSGFMSGRIPLLWYNVPSHSSTQ